MRPQQKEKTRAEEDKGNPGGKPATSQENNHSRINEKRSEKRNRREMKHTPVNTVEKKEFLHKPGITGERGTRGAPWEGRQ